MSNISQLKEKAESGNTKAMRELAMKYMKGDGVRADMDEGFEWVEKAAKRGDAESQYDLADMIRAMDGPLNEYFYWIQKSAEQGFPMAQHNMAICFQDGVGTPVDPGKQFFWLQKAAESGLAESQHQLAQCFLHGVGTPEDHQQAIYWLQRASDGGHAVAKRKLGALYMQGTGVEADEEKGRALIQEAASLGDQAANELLKESKAGGRKKRSLIGRIVGKFFGTLHKSTYIYLGTVWDMFWQTARKDGYGVAFFCTIFGILIFVPLLCIKLIFSPFVAIYEHMTEE